MRCVICSDKAIGAFCDRCRPNDTLFGSMAAGLADPNVDTADLEPISLDGPSSSPAASGVSVTASPGK